MLRPGVIGPGSMTLVLWVIFFEGWGFLNNCFGIWPKLLMNPIVAFFLRGSSMLWSKNYKNVFQNSIGSSQQPFFFFLSIFCSLVNVDVSLVKQVMKNIDSIDSRWTVLFTAKYEIDPMVQMLRNVVALQGESVSSYEFAWILFCPRWKNYVAKLNATLFRTCKKIQKNVTLHEQNPIPWKRFCKDK